MPREAKQEHLGSFFVGEKPTIRLDLQAISREDLSGTAALTVYEPTGEATVSMDAGETVGDSYAEFTLDLSDVDAADGYRANFVVTLTGGNVVIAQYTFDVLAVYP